MRSVLRIGFCVGIFFSCVVTAQPSSTGPNESEGATQRKRLEANAATSNFSKFELARLLYMQAEFDAEKPKAIRLFIEAFNERDFGEQRFSATTAARVMLRGVPPQIPANPVAAITLLKETCNAGDYISCGTLSDIYFSGPGYQRIAGRPDVNIEIDKPEGKRYFDAMMAQANTALIAGDGYAAAELGKRRGAWDERDPVAILSYQRLARHRNAGAGAAGMNLGGIPVPATPEASQKSIQLAAQWEAAHGRPIPDGARLVQQLLQTLRLNDSGYGGGSHYMNILYVPVLLGEIGAQPESPNYLRLYSIAIDGMRPAYSRRKTALESHLKDLGISANPYYAVRLGEVFDGYELEYLARYFAEGPGSKFLKFVDGMNKLQAESFDAAGKLGLIGAGDSINRLKSYADRNRLTLTQEDMSFPVSGIEHFYVQFSHLRDGHDVAQADFYGMATILRTVTRVLNRDKYNRLLGSMDQRDIQKVFQFHREVLWHQFAQLPADRERAESRLAKGKDIRKEIDAKFSVDLDQIRSRLKEASR